MRARKQHACSEELPANRMPAMASINFLLCVRVSKDAMAQHSTATQRDVTNGNKGGKQSKFL
jgi:hypothetical protein